MGIVVEDGCRVAANPENEDKLDLGYLRLKKKFFMLIEYQLICHKVRLERVLVKI